MKKFGEKFLRPKLKKMGKFFVENFYIKKKKKKLLAWELAAAVVEGERPEGGPHRLRAQGSEPPASAGERAAAGECQGASCRAASA